LADGETLPTSFGQPSLDDDDDEHGELQLESSLQQPYVAGSRHPPVAYALL
jgi:hypothetical protein